MNLKFCGILAEMQIHLSNILEIKETLHKYYELMRAKEVEQMKTPVFIDHHQLFKAKDTDSKNQHTSRSLEIAKRFLQKLRDLQSDKRFCDFVLEKQDPTKIIRETFRREDILTEYDQPE